MCVRVYVCVCVFTYCCVRLDVSTQPFPEPTPLARPSHQTSLESNVLQMLGSSSLRSQLGISRTQNGETMKHDPTKWWIFMIFHGFLDFHGFSISIVELGRTSSTEFQLENDLAIFEPPLCHTTVKLNNVSCTLMQIAPPSTSQRQEAFRIHG